MKRFQVSFRDQVHAIGVAEPGVRATVKELGWTLIENHSPSD